MKQTKHPLLVVEVERLERRLQLTTHYFDSSNPLSLEMTDSNITFELTRQGYGTVTVDDATNSFHVEVAGTSDRSTLRIRGSGETLTLGGIEAAEGLRQSIVRGIDTLNASLNFQGGIDRIKVEDIVGSEILVGETTYTDDVLIIMDAASDLNVSSGQIVKQIRADQIVDADGLADEIRAPAIQRVVVRGTMDAMVNSTSWIASLPLRKRRKILWAADHEEGNLFDWHQGGGPNSGGGLFNTGGDEVEAVASTDVAHSGEFSARTTITNAYLAENGDRAVRLFRWTDRPWDQGGEQFPDKAYFSTWMYIPENYDPDTAVGGGGWWNVFQFKSDDLNGISQPMFSVNIGVNSAGEMVPYLWQAQTHQSHLANQEIAFQAGEWTHLEAYYKADSGDRGRITVYQNGERVFDLNGVQTVMPGGSEVYTWSVNNYTNHIEGGNEPGTATIYFDDTIVSESRVSNAL